MNLKHVIVAVIVGMAAWVIPILVYFGTHSLVGSVVIFLAELVVLALVGLRISKRGAKSL